MKKTKLVLLLASAGMLTSCDLSQIPGLDKRLSYEDSKAVGAACRHSGRALEDCFALNPLSHQAGVFEGWRDMNDYMMENKIEVVKPEIDPGALMKKKPVDTASSDAHKADAGHAVAHSEPGPSGPPPALAESTRPKFDPSKLGRSVERGGDPAATAPASGEADKPWERRTSTGSSI